VRTPYPTHDVLDAFSLLDVSADKNIHALATVLKSKLACWQASRCSEAAVRRREGEASRSDQVDCSCKASQAGVSC